MIEAAIEAVIEAAIEAVIEADPAPLYVATNRLDLDMVPKLECSTFCEGVEFVLHADEM